MSYESPINFLHTGGLYTGLYESCNQSKHTWMWVWVSVKEVLLTNNTFPTKTTYHLHKTSLKNMTTHFSFKNPIERRQSILFSYLCHSPALPKLPYTDTDILGHSPTHIQHHLHKAVPYTGPAHITSPCSQHRRHKWSQIFLEVHTCHDHYSFVLWWW